MERWCWTVQWLLGTAKACMSIGDESAYSLHLYSEHRTEESSALSMQRVMHLGRQPGETPLEKTTLRSDRAGVRISKVQQTQLGRVGRRLAVSGSQVCCGPSCLGSP